MREFPPCDKCGSNEHVVKRGRRKNKYVEKQTYWCKNCEHRFTPEDGFKRRCYPPKVITAAIDLYHRGLSLNQTRDHLEQFYHVKPSDVAILKWLRYYGKLLKDYTDGLKPKIKGNVHADEVYLHKKGKKNDKYGNTSFYYFSAIDSQTRFLWGNLEERRDSKSAQRLFGQVKSNSRGKPKRIVNDGFWGYRRAFNKHFYTRYKEDRIDHRHGTGLKGQINQMKIERANGTIKQRTKVMRGFTNYSSARDIMDGNNVFYNFIRRHRSKGLKGSTPAEKARIRLPLGRNKWLGLIFFSPIFLSYFYRFISLI